MTSDPSPHQYGVRTVQSRDIGVQPFWPSLYETIIAGYKLKRVAAVAPGSSRLRTPIERGLAQLIEELGPEGMMVVVLDQDHAVAAAGVLPYDESEVAHRWTSDRQPETNHSQSRSQHEDWIMVCVTTAPSHRGRGLYQPLEQQAITQAKSRGGRRLFVHYIKEEIDHFWRAQGFQVVEGSDQQVPKGFQYRPDEVPLDRDLTMRLSVKDI